MRSFNSTTVQLILSLRKVLRLLLLRFNSTTVQLILLNTLVLKARFLLFQFHNGTINTPPVGAPLPGSNVFQFHNGTINTSNQHMPYHR